MQPHHHGQPATTCVRAVYFRTTKMFPSSSATNYTFERRWFNFYVKLGSSRTSACIFARPWSAVPAGRGEQELSGCLCTISDASRLFLSSSIAHSISLPFSTFLFFRHFFSSSVSFNARLTNIRLVSGGSVFSPEYENTVIESSFFFSPPIYSRPHSVISVSEIYIPVTIISYIRQPPSEIHFPLSYENRKISVLTWDIRGRETEGSPLENEIILPLAECYWTSYSLYLSEYFH